MSTSRTVEKQDGAKAELIFSDGKGNLLEEAEATHVEIVEYDSKGKVVKRTYAEKG